MKGKKREAGTQKRQLVKMRDAAGTKKITHSYGTFARLELQPGHREIKREGPRGDLVIEKGGKFGRKQPAEHRSLGVGQDATKSARCRVKLFPTRLTSKMGGYGTAPSTPYVTNLGIGVKTVSLLETGNSTQNKEGPRPPRKRDSLLSREI